MNWKIGDSSIKSIVIRPNKNIKEEPVTAKDNAIFKWKQIEIEKDLKRIIGLMCPWVRHL